MRLAGSGTVPPQFGARCAEHGLAVMAPRSSASSAMAGLHNEHLAAGQPVTCRPTWEVTKVWRDAGGPYQSDTYTPGGD